MKTTRYKVQSIMWFFMMVSITSIAAEVTGIDNSTSSHCIDQLERLKETNRTGNSKKTDNATRLNEVDKKIDDTFIISQIKFKFTKDPLLNSIGIEVTSEDGYVCLIGEVASNTEYSQAVMLADSVDSVRDVDASELKVNNSSQPLTDTLITAKVQGKIIKEKLFGDNDVKYWTVKVETKNGTVFLSGTIENHQQKDNLIHIAQSVVEDKEKVNVDALKVKRG